MWYEVIMWYAAKHVIKSSQVENICCHTDGIPPPPPSPPFNGATAVYFLQCCNMCVLQQGNFPFNVTGNFRSRAHPSEHPLGVYLVFRWKNFPFVPTIEMSTFFSFPSKNQINAQGAVTEKPGITVLLHWINTPFNGATVLLHWINTPSNGTTVLLHWINTPFNGATVLLHWINTPFNGATVLLHWINTPFNGATVLLHWINTPSNGATVLLHWINTPFNGATVLLHWINTPFNGATVLLYTAVG